MMSNSGTEANGQYGGFNLTQILANRRLEILEARIVREIMEAANRREDLQDLRQEAGETLGLDLFHKRFPAFPIRLAGGKTEFNFGANLMFAGFRDNPLYSEYFHRFGTAPFLGHGYYGLIVPAGPLGLMAMHNDLPRDRTGEKETRVELTYGRRKTRLVVELLSLVLRGIPAGWEGGLVRV